uniref:Peptidase_M16_M domain-containing protein n=1 Tax=Steinernema glaseri TaxID=37863 RepID=A0A1I7YAX3_9BILA
MCVPASFRNEGEGQGGKPSKTSGKETEMFLLQTDVFPEDFPKSSKASLALAGRAQREMENLGIDGRGLGYESFVTDDTTCHELNISLREPSDATSTFAKAIEEQKINVLENYCEGMPAPRIRWSPAALLAVTGNIVAVIGPELLKLWYSEKYRHDLLEFTEAFSRMEVKARAEQFDNAMRTLFRESRMADFATFHFANNTHDELTTLADAHVYITDCLPKDLTMYALACARKD